MKRVTSIEQVTKAQNFAMKTSLKANLFWLKVSTMEHVKSFKNIKENKIPPDLHTQRGTVDIKHISLYSP